MKKGNHKINFLNLSFINKKIILFSLAIFILLVSFSLVYSINQESSTKNQLKVTKEHPFYLEGEWVAAKDLKVGDTFKTIDGKTAIIKSIKLIEEKEPFYVYNLEVPIYTNFVVGPHGLIVHNSNVPSKVKLDYIDTPNGRVPVPHEDNIPIIDQEAARTWVGTQAHHAHLSDTMPKVRQAIIDNVETIDFDVFSRDLETAVKNFNSYVGNDPYVMVVYSRSGSEQWTFDIASQWLDSKPSRILYLDQGYETIAIDIDTLSSQGVNRYVFFDDASYSGSRITRDTGMKVGLFFDDYARQTGISPSDYEFISVVSRASSEAEDMFSVLMKERGVLFSGGKIKTVEEVVESLNKQGIIPSHSVDLIYDELGMNAVHPILPDQSLAFFSHKVADSLSVPTPIAKMIVVPGTSTPYRSLTLEPYKQSGTEYFHRSRETRLP
jgi:hypothetical protein